MKFKVLNQNIAVKRDLAPEKTESGLFLVSDFAKKPMSGVVLTVGKEVTDIKEGDKVLFEKNSKGQEVQIDGESILILDQKYIIGILE